MKIAICYSGYLPGEKYGGPVTSIYNFTELLGDDNEIYILCSNHDLKDTTPYTGIKEGWNTVGKAHVVYLSDQEFNEKRILNIFDEINPELVYVSSIFSVKFNSPAYKAAYKKSIPVLLAPRGELNSKALLNGKLKKKFYIRFFKSMPYFKNVSFQATSDGEFNDIIHVLKINESRISFLPNIPALPEEKSDIDKQSGKVKMCFVGRIVPNKNLAVALEALQHVTSEVSFDIFGAQEDTSYWELCQKLISQEPKNVKVNYCGVVNQLKMRNMYKDYDCLISPTQFENYGQAIVEAMLHDVPVIISKGTTPWDDISKDGAGYTVEIQDVRGYASVIDSISCMSREQYELLIMRLRKYCINRFDFQYLKEKYMNSFSIMSKQTPER